MSIMLSVKEYENLKDRAKGREAPGPSLAERMDQVTQDVIVKKENEQRRQDLEPLRNKEDDKQQEEDVGKEHELRLGDVVPSHHVDAAEQLLDVIFRHPELDVVKGTVYLKHLGRVGPVLLLLFSLLSSDSVFGHWATFKKLLSRAGCILHKSDQKVGIRKKKENNKKTRKESEKRVVVLRKKQKKTKPKLANTVPIPVSLKYL